VVLGAVAALIIGFSIRYRRGSKAKRGLLPPFISHEVEIAWTTGTLFTFLFIFWWASSLQLAAKAPPADAMPIRVLAKQWMWKTEHSNGAREINALHVPVGRPVKLLMTSQDVIHSFYVPAFRMKQDVLPGRTTTAWFQATRTGTFPRGFNRRNSGVRCSCLRRSTSMVSYSSSFSASTTRTFCPYGQSG